MGSRLPDPEVEAAVVAFFDDLFRAVFSEPFARDLAVDRLRRRAVERQVEAVADASSQAITRFFHNERLRLDEVERILAGWSTLRERIAIEDVANVNVTPESLAERLGPDLGCPAEVTNARQEAVYRFALHTVMQVLMLAGPVMAEWRRLNFATSFALVQQVVQRLDQIGTLLAVGRSGQETADERYGLSYRGHLLLRFNRVEAGTVRMTTNMAVDLRELFVMPKVRACPKVQRDVEGSGLMLLAEARLGLKPSKKDDAGRPVLDEVRERPRMVLVGAPGSGKSSFLEWLQLQLAEAVEELVLGDQQAIPLLLRVRQLDPKAMPEGSGMIERATLSKQIATLMPPGWLDRQMAKGRVLVMVDGLDEVDPDARKKHILPWLTDLCRRYPACRYLISSRPVGYEAGTLDELGFVEYELLDFDEPAVLEYAQRWSTSVRLAQNEPEAEARAEGRADGQRIVAGFKEHPHIRSLARNPLMLSAICLVDHFENGELPKDRVLLYRLCVEGLLHYWDQRRGIRSEFGLEEKTHVCREIAVAMQAGGQAEMGLADVQTIAGQVLGDNARGGRLVEHVRARTGLLVERRRDVFAFAHLTFQEYLAAVAVDRGNLVGIDPDMLVREHQDDRWQEVIALYSGIAATSAVRGMLEQIMALSENEAMAAVLANAFVASGRELASDIALRRAVIRRIALTYFGRADPALLDSFPRQDVAQVVNEVVGAASVVGMCAYVWLWQHPQEMDVQRTMGRLRNHAYLEPVALAHLVWVTHYAGVRALLDDLDMLTRLYARPDAERHGFPTQGAAAMSAFANSDVATRDDAGDWVPLVKRLFSAVAAADKARIHAWEVYRKVEPEHLLDAWTPHLTSAERAELAPDVALLASKFPYPDVAARLHDWAARFAPAPKPRKKKRSPR